MSEKLLPCPFCGAPADPPELYGESKTAMFVDCSKCGANVYHGTADKEANSAAVVVAWNRRASLPQPAAGSTWRDQIIPGTIEAFVARMKHVIDNYGSKLGLTDEKAAELAVLLTKHGFVPSTPALCEDEGCPHYGTAHVCVSTPAQSVLVEALHKISNPFDHGHCGTCGKECAGATDCDCSFPVWEQDNPIAIAKAALSHAPFQPAPVVDEAELRGALILHFTGYLSRMKACEGECGPIDLAAVALKAIRECREDDDALRASPQPDGEGEIREGIVRDRAYGNGMKQALREIWPLVKEAPGVVDAIAKKMGELDKRADQFSTDALTAFTSSNSPQATEEGK